MATEVPIKSNLCLEHPPKSERDPGELVVAVVGGTVVVVVGGMVAVVVGGGGKATDQVSFGT